MIALESHEHGTLLPIQAQPKACRNGLNGTHNGRLKVQITQTPEQGKANKAIARILAQTLGIATSRVVLWSGATSAHKTFLIEEIAPAALRQQLQSQF